MFNKHCYLVNNYEMKPWCLFLICLSCNLMRVGADYYPRYRDKSVPYLFLAGVLIILLLSVGTRRSSQDLTIIRRRTSNTTRKQLRCSDGYTLYSGPGRSFCFRFSNSFKSWESAQTVCRMENAELLVLDNDSLSAFGNFMRQKFPPWGATWLRAKTGANGIASYIGGPTIPSNSPLWVRGQPATPNDCIVLGYGDSGTLLREEPCGNILSHVCQKL